MTEFDLVVRGGTVVTAADTIHCDIGVRDGRISALADNLPLGGEEIDASGLLVLPGGIDGHCHLDQPLSDGAVMADDFFSGTRSAACGGTTTVIPFACQTKGDSLRAAVEDYHQRADGKAVIDYAFHLIVSDPTEQVLGQELPALIEEGYTSFKIYMTYDDLKLNDRQILDTLALARQHGAMVMMHAENSDGIAWLTERLELEGRTAPKYHAVSRPMPIEREATQRAITLAELAEIPILLVHVSSRDAVEQIRWAQGRGLRIYAETCPQYVLLTAEDLDLPGFEGAKCVCSPPPRDASSHQAIWDGLTSGLFQVFSSDHAPFRYEDSKGKKLKGGIGIVPVRTQWNSGYRDPHAPVVFRRRQRGTAGSQRVRRADGNKSREDVRSPSSKRDDRHRQRCGYCAVGPGPGSYGKQRNVAPRCGLHTLRRDDSTRLAHKDYIAWHDSVG